MTNETHTHTWRWYPGDAGREAEGYWRCTDPACGQYREGWGVTPDDGEIEPDPEPGESFDDPLGVDSAVNYGGDV